MFTKRFTVQERVGEQIADTLMELIAPAGVAVRLEASHLCTRMRGVEEHSATVTTFWRGVFCRPRAPPGVPDRGAWPQSGRMTKLDPLELLYESPAAPPSELTAALSQLYGGGLGFAAPTVFTNFVVSLDGSVALPGIPTRTR